MSDSLQPYGLQPATFLYPWDFPGKNNGMGLSCLHSGGLLNPEIKPMSLKSPAFVGRFFTTSATLEAPNFTVPRVKIVDFISTKTNRLLYLILKASWKNLLI